MEDTLKSILEKLGKLDRIESYISALKNDNHITHTKLDIIINEVANIKEQITDHDIKIQSINKTKAI